MTEKTSSQELHTTRRHLLRDAVLLAAGAAVTGGGSGARAGDEVPAEPAIPEVDPGAVDSVDVASPGALILAVYEGVGFSPESPPDWAFFQGLFYPGARLGAPTPHGFHFTDVQGFIGGFEKSRESGSIIAFREWDLWHRMDSFGAMAQAFCSYESLANGEMKSRGINAMQFVREHGRWWCASIIWDRETEDLPIPAEFL